MGKIWYQKQLKYIKKLKYGKNRILFFMVPKLSEKSNLVAPSKITVFNNGVLVQNNVELLGPTLYVGSPHFERHESNRPQEL